MNMNTITTTTDDNDQVRSWLQGQIKGCLQVYGVQEWLYPVIENALYEQSEIEPLTDEQQETVREALEQLRETDRSLSLRQWEQARLDMLTAHNMLRQCGVAVNRVAGWSRELYLQLDEIDESIEYAICEPGSLDWVTWQGPEGCSVLTRQTYYQDHELPEVLDAWEAGLPVSVVDGALTATIIDDDPDQD